MIDILFCFLGIGLGLAMGMVPGMHINNFLPFFSALALSNQQFFFLVIAMSMSYVFSSLFPSILLGIPNEDTALTVLPGHRLALEGNAYSSLVISLISGFLVIFISAPFLIVFLKFLPLLYPIAQQIIPYFLLVLLAFMIFSDNKSAIIVVALSSILGFLTFNFNLLLPLLSGFFGVSTMIISLSSTGRIPPQTMKFNSKLSLSNISSISFMACFLSAIFGFIPAISSSIVGTMGSYVRKLNSEEFLALTSGTNVAYMVYSFFALLLIGKTRSGSAVFLSQIFESESIFFVFGIVLLSSAISFIICLTLSKRFVKFYKRFNYRKLSLASILFVVLINFALSGLFGLLVLFTSTSLGLLANSLQVRRTACMACLIAPTIAVLL